MALLIICSLFSSFTLLVVAFLVPNEHPTLPLRSTLTLRQWISQLDQKVITTIYQCDIKLGDAEPSFTIQIMINSFQKKNPLSQIQCPFCLNFPTYYFSHVSEFCASNVSYYHRSCRNTDLNIFCVFLSALTVVESNDEVVRMKIGELGGCYIYYYIYGRIGLEIRHLRNLCMYTTVAFLFHFSVMLLL